MAIQNAAPPAVTSRVLQITEALIYKDGETSGEDFQDTLEDMIEGCQMHGKVRLRHPLQV